MAEAALISAAKSVLPKLGKLALNEAIACCGARGNLKDLEETMETIEAVLCDAEQQQDNNPAVKLWLQRLRRALYEADDLFDEVFAHDKSRKLLGTLSKVRGLFSASNPVWLSWNVAGKIRSIRQNLDKVTAEMEHFNFKKGQPPISKHDVRDETIPYVVELDIVGREADKQKILKMLCGVEERGVDIPEVAAIVGVGGLGKTTLAQLVYNDNIVSEKFEVKAWACVYDENNRRKVIEGKILKSIFQSCEIQPDGKPELEASFIRSIISERYDEVDINKIRTSIGEMLEGKKYLLVLDDVWDDNRSYWVELFRFLRKGNRESKIVGTMRSKGVADSMGVHKSKLHILEDLDTKEAKRLFTSFAFRREWVGDVSRTDLGREIFQMLPKVPLVLRSVGSMLFSKSSLSEWESMKNDIPQLMSSVEGEYNNVLKVLKFSYDHLSSPLKRCFAYCALFPKGHEFDKDSLIRLWVAQGFIQPSIASHGSLEDVGHKKFIELLNKSFFLIEQKDNELCHKMHDIMHDLAKHVARDEVSMISECRETMQRDSDLRHVAFNLVSPSSLKVGAARQIRSVFISETKKISPECVELVCTNFISLRVLDLHKLNILHVPDSIGGLIHLRYLDLSENEMMEYLPNSVTRLINLQTLNLFCCESLRELPKRFGRLINMRHLNIKRCDNLSCMPRGIGGLQTLQTFEGCLVVNGPSGLDDLTGLNFHSKWLEVRCGGWEANINPMGREVGDLDSNFNNDTIETHIKVNGLQITFQCEDQLEAQFGMYFLQRVKIQNLKKLIIKRYHVERFPGWGTDRSMTIPPLFNNLIEIEILFCSNCKILPSFSLLPHLKVLSLSHLYDMEYIESPLSISSTPPLSFFPSLEKLELNCLSDLKGWFRFSKSNSSPSKDPSINNTTTGEALHAFTLPSFPRLSFIKIYGSPSVTDIPPLLPDVLHKVVLSGIPESLGMQLLNTIGSPIAMTSSTFFSNQPLLLTATPEYFEIMGFGNLTSLSFVEGASKSIKELKIQRCPKLCLLEGMESLTSLQKLTISSCEALDVWKEEEDTSTTLTPWQLLSNNCKSLRVLRMEGASKWGTLPSGIKLLTTLQEMNIGNLHDLKALPEWFGNLIHLKKLSFWECSQLSHLRGLESLTSLENLDLGGCGSLDLLVEEDSVKSLTAWEHLSTNNGKSLHVLQLYGSELESLPSGLQLLTNLQDLTIQKFRNLKAMPEWIGNLTHLQSLLIGECPKLTSLPKSMLNLTALQRLVIFSCGDAIKKKWEETTGEYWPLIQRIPDIEICFYLLCGLEFRLSESGS